MVDEPALSLAEWIVLALIAEQPRHGFAVASLTERDGDVGRAWHVPRPIVYRAITSLEAAELIAVDSTEQGRRGPQRWVYAATPAGRVAVRRWLRSPVAHVRDGRSELLVKLALLDRRRLSTRALITAQRRVFLRIERALSSPAMNGTAGTADTDGFGRVLRAWRLESARAALRFLDDVEQE